MASPSPPPPPPVRKRAPPRPPLIGRAGNLTIFITPPPAPNTISPNYSTPNANSNPCPVQAPPIRWQHGDLALSPVSLDSVYEFLCTALAKAQHVHSSVDYYLADWFGLNHSKYQRELDEYYYQTMQKPLKTASSGDNNRAKLKEEKSRIEAL